MRRFSRSNEDSLSQCLDAHPVLGASRYDHYLSLWKDAFPDLLVLFDEDFSTKENLEATTRRVEDYLGLNEHDEYDFTQIWNAIEGLENNAKRKLYNNETKTAIHDELHDDIRLSAIKNLREMAKHHDAPEIPSEWVEKYSDHLQHEETKTKTNQVVSSEVDFTSKNSRRMLKEWTPKTARGKFYGQASSFSAFDVDPKILAELKDESNKDSQFAFVPVLHKQNALRRGQSIPRQRRVDHRTRSHGVPKGDHFPRVVARGLHARAAVGRVGRVLWRELLLRRRR